MSADFKSEPRSFALTVYGVLLRCYPKAFRRRYEEEMLGVFREEWTRARDQGASAVIDCTLRLLWDMVRTVPREWSAATSRAGALAFFAAGLGLIYLVTVSTPLAFKVLGCATLTGAMGLVALGLEARRWRAHLQLGVLGLAAGGWLASGLDLRPHRTLPPQGPVLPVKDRALDGPEIFRRMAAVYRTATSYSDTGEVQTTYALPFRRTHTKTFSTAFVRNGGFRFEFKDQFQRLDPWNEYAVWLEEGKARAWWTIEPHMGAQKDLAFALAGPAGISSNASTHVPGLLFSNARIEMLTYAARHSELLGIEPVEGRNAYKLAFDTGHDWSRFLWIDARSYLIVRILSRHGLTWAPGAETEELLIYHPRLNAPVDPATLTFQPGPAQSFIEYIFAGGQNHLLFFCGGLSVLITLLNVVHRRVLGGAWRWKKEIWLVALGRRLPAGYFGVLAVNAGLWLGGVEFELVMTNNLLAIFMMQAGFGLYVMHRRTSGYARLAAM